MSVNYEVLEYLRSRKRKDLILLERIYLKYKLNSIIQNRMDLFNEYNRVEHSKGIDTKDADKYEYEFRFNAYKRGLKDFYKNHGEDVGMDLFTERIIRDSMESEKRLKLRRG